MDHVKLTFNHFLHYFVWHPTSKKLSPRDQKIALLGTALLLVATWGLGHAVCEIFFYNRAYFKKDSRNFDCAAKRFNTEQDILARQLVPVHQINIGTLGLDTALDISAESHQQLLSYPLSLTKKFDRNLAIEGKDLDLIEERFHALQESFNLLERTNELASQSHLALLTFADIVCSMEDSPLPFAIMSVGELQNLPISVLGDLNERQLAVVRARLPEITKRKTSSEPQTVAELLGLSEKKLKEAVFTLPPGALRCLSGRQVASLHRLESNLKNNLAKLKKILTVVDRSTLK
ncbi:MAG: hypothetical protein ACSNEK_00980 [Parachlamydiaceae bacterium]